MRSLKVLNEKFQNTKTKSGNFLNDGRDMNLVNMILNVEANNSNNYKKPLDVYDVYHDMQELDVNREFRNSIKNSKNCVMVPPITSIQLSSLKKNDPNSFLALPVLGKGHLWSTLIRRTDEGFSAVIINKGLRFWHDPIEEFVFNEKNKDKLVSALKYCGAFTMRSVEDVYRKFIDNSDKRFNMAINASPQKVGNCFTKNIQAAIKFAYGTRKMPVKEFNKLRIDKEYTSFGTPDKNRVTFKWDVLTTEQMQKLFVKKIVDKNPNIKPMVDESVLVYTSNKHFRQKIKAGKDPVDSFIETFSKNISKSLSKEEKIKEGLKSITPFTYGGIRNQLDQIVKQTNDKEYIDVYKKLGKFTDLSKIEMGNLYFHFFMEARHDVFNSLIHIFDRSGSLKNLSKEQRVRQLAKNLNPAILMIHRNKIKDLLKEVYKKETIDVEFKELMQDSKKRVEEINRQMPSAKEQEKFAEYFPIVVGQVNHRISEYYNTLAQSLIEKEDKPKVAMEFIKNARKLENNPINYYLKGLCFSKLGEYNKAIKEFDQSIQMDNEQPLAYLYRARAYEKTNNKTAARNDYESFKKYNVEYKTNNSVNIESNLAGKNLQLVI